MDRSPWVTAFAAPTGGTNRRFIEALSPKSSSTFCALVLALASFFWMSSAMAEPLVEPDRIAQADLQIKKRKGPIVAPEPVEEYELNKGPLTPGPVEGIELEKGPIVAPGPPADMADMLNVHNERRARHCVPPLVWSPELAQAAQSYANECILGEHGSTGENMANWVTIENGKPVLPARTDRQIFEDAWYCEIDNYDFDAPKIVGGFKQNCDPPVNGHFTQIVWRTTTQIGCGRAICTIGGQQGTNWVCRYAPAGNSGPPGPNVPAPCQ